MVHQFDRRDNRPSARHFGEQLSQRCLNGSALVQRTLLQIHVRQTSAIIEYRNARRNSCGQLFTFSATRKVGYANSSRMTRALVTSASVKLVSRPSCGNSTFAKRQNTKSLACSAVGTPTLCNMELLHTIPDRPFGRSC